MATAIARYNPPEDPAAFDSYYESTHVPLAKTMPGLRSYEVSAGPIAVQGNGVPYHLVAVLKFESMGALQAALASPEGQAVVADLPNFATGGVTVLLFDDKSI